MTGWLGGAHFHLPTFLRSGMQQNAALKQRKSCLSITAAFDPFHFIHKSLDHPIARGLGTSIHYGFCIVSQSLHKAFQFRNARSSYGSFPLLQSRFPFQVAEKGAKCLSEGVGNCGFGITLAELINERRLGLCSLLGRTNDHECGISRRRRFLQRDCLLGDQFCPMRAQLRNDAFDCPQRTRLSLSYDLFIELKSCMAPIVPSLAQRRQVWIYHMMTALPPLASGGLFLLQGTIDAAAAHPDDTCNVLFSSPATIQLPDPLMMGDAASHDGAPALVRHALLQGSKAQEALFQRACAPPH